VNTYDEFFAQATDGHSPLPYQRRLAEADPWPARLAVPTGLGKTAAAVVAWLWRRQEAPEATPRRLVFCLPMRVLVEQTRDAVVGWLDRLGRLAGSLDGDRYRPDYTQEGVAAVTLMGGESDGGWDVHPERELIVIGTQDMLLSRALNRGYGMSRYRWPVHFALLNEDVQWVVDEVQLMGPGLPTTTQLQAFRRGCATLLPARTLWMSATFEESWLDTVDAQPDDIGGELSLEDDDREHPVARDRLEADKRLERLETTMGEASATAEAVLAEHRPGSRTLVVLNTVKRAAALFEALEKTEPAARVVLVHSRFRAPEREEHLGALLDEPGDEGTIAVSTQVVEAGVDVSAATLVTEVAPWASLVQRFGRCNRRGEVQGGGRVLWLPLPEDADQQEKLARPYEVPPLLDSQARLAELQEVGPAALPHVALPMEHDTVLRRRDLLDLFDTTQDLMGQETDVSRFVRDATRLDVRVFWREFAKVPDPSEPSPARSELCSAPLGDLRAWLKKKPAWVYDGLERRWRRLQEGDVYPGLLVLLRAADGGYDAERGWNPRSKAAVTPVVLAEPPSVDRDLAGDPLSERAWLSLTQHAQDVAAVAADLVDRLRLAGEWADTVTGAARWHDAGKAHPVFQRTLRGEHEEAPPELLAKAPHGGRHERRGFRHELASALLALAHGKSDLFAYLVLAHHGKVRLSLRAQPGEQAPPEGGRRFARGVWDGDRVPDPDQDPPGAEHVDLGRGEEVPATALTLSYMELGLHPETGRSWLERALRLRDELGPFRLAFLETLIRCADERASADPGCGGTP